MIYGHQKFLQANKSYGKAAMTFESGKNKCHHQELNHCLHTFITEPTMLTIKLSGHAIVSH
jgi:hypothetical protein